MYPVSHVVDALSLLWAAKYPCLVKTLDPGHAQGNALSIGLLV
jgi:hypothetical protein